MLSPTKALYLHPQNSADKSKNKFQMLFIGRYSVLCNKFNGNAWYIIDNFVNSCYLHCFIGREGLFCERR